MLYKRMYLTLFRGITKALEALQARNYGLAEQILISAQCDAEEQYISAEEPEK